MLKNCVNNTRRKSTISPGIVRSFGLVGLIVVLGFLGSGAGLAEEPSMLALPFSIGETWYICQGYNNPQSDADGGTHHGTDKYALDLSVHPDSPGDRGCSTEDRDGKSIEDASAGYSVLAPADGIVASVNSDNGGLCLNLDRGESMWIAHMTDMPKVGTDVERGDELGTVASAGNAGNNDYAHIHIRIQPKHGCGGPSQGGEPIPFDDAHGTRFEGAPSLPDTGETNQHSGKSLTRLKRDDAQFVAQSAYPTVKAGQSFQIYFEVKNTGFDTWRRDENYYLANINNTPLGANSRQEVDSDVPPEAIKRWNMSMIAPSAPGTYRTQWMLKHGDKTFGPNMFIDVTVVTKPEDGWRRIIERIRQALERLIEDLKRKLEEIIEGWQRRMEQEMGKAIQRFIEDFKRELERAIQETCAGPAALLVGTCAFALAKARQSGRKR